MNKLVLSGILVLASFLLLGCTEQKTYICSDGRAVLSQSECNIAAASTPSPTAIKSECPYDCCTNEALYLDKICTGEGVCSSHFCTRKISNYWEAIDQLKNREQIAKEWENGARQKDCAASSLDLSRSVALVAKVDFSKNLIECNQVANFYGFIDAATKKEQTSGCPPGQMCILESSSAWLTTAQADVLKNCDASVISETKKLVNGFTSPFGNIAETCSECNQVYFVWVYCAGQVDNGFAYYYVDAQTGRAYR